jgi:ribonuclease E
MADKKHVAEVEKSFKKALSIDRARIQLSRISKFGMLELSRQKKQSTIQEISYTTCPYCKGSGLRPSLEYAALGAFRKIQSEAVKGIYSELRIILPHEIAGYILNQKRSEILNLETTFGLNVHISGRTEMPWDKLDIQQIIKEQVLEKPAVQEELPLKTAENSLVKDEPKEPVKKKSRRRPRHKKRRTGEIKTEDSLSAILPVTAAEENLPVMQPPLLEAVPLVITQTEAKETVVTSEPKEPAIPINEKEKSDESV